MSDFNDSLFSDAELENSNESWPEWTENNEGEIEFNDCNQSMHKQKNVANSNAQKCWMCNECHSINNLQISTIFFDSKCTVCKKDTFNPTEIILSQTWHELNVCKKEKKSSKFFSCFAQNSQKTIEQKIETQYMKNELFLIAPLKDYEWLTAFHKRFAQKLFFGYFRQRCISKLRKTMIHWYSPKDIISIISRYYGTYEGDYFIGRSEGFGYLKNKIFSTQRVMDSDNYWEVIRSYNIVSFKNHEMIDFYLNNINNYEEENTFCYLWQIKITSEEKEICKLNDIPFKIGIISNENNESKKEKVNYNDKEFDHYISSVHCILRTNDIITIQLKWIQNMCGKVNCEMSYHMNHKLIQRYFIDPHKKYFLSLGFPPITINRIIIEMLQSKWFENENDHIINRICEICNVCDDNHDCDNYEIKVVNHNADNAKSNQLSQEDIEVIQKIYAEND